MVVVPVDEAELVEVLVVLAPDELDELELQAAMSVTAATAATAAVVARRGPAPVRLRSVMEPPEALSGSAERAGAGCGLAPGVPCVTKNRSDVCVCQWPESARLGADTKQIPDMSSDLWPYAGLGLVRSPDIPPSTARALPVVAPASALAREGIAAPTSSALTSLPMGWRAISAARSAAGSGAASSRRLTHGVSAVPGVTQLTLMCSATWSSAMASVSA